MQRVAAGLHAAHKRGVIHRDVSSDNVILPDGDLSLAKIIDFGIARSTQANDTTVIADGFAGKINYISPEQLGLFGANVTAKSDIYSLGLVLVEALTGRPLDMGGTYLEIIEKRRKLPDLAALDLRIRPLIEQMLQPDPARRPQSMAVVANWPLDPSLVPPAPSRGLEAGLPNPDSQGRRKRWLTGAVSTLMIAIAFGWNFIAPAGMGWTKNAETATEIAAPEKIRRFVKYYDGGQCFFAAPVVIRQSATWLDAYSSSMQALNTLGRKFRSELGFDPVIGMRVVNRAQCPAVDFLTELSGSPARVPRVAIDQYTLSPGESLTGTVEGAGDTELLFVADGGSVTNVSRLMTQTVGGRSFKIDMAEVGATSGQPQLFIAIAGAPSLDEPQRKRPVAAKQFFPEILRAALASGKAISATARYLKFEDRR
jgi:serine/threonine-protein kinase